MSALPPTGSLPNLQNHSLISCSRRPVLETLVQLEFWLRNWTVLKFDNPFWHKTIKAFVVGCRATTAPLLTPQNSQSILPDSLLKETHLDQPSTHPGTHKVSILCQPCHQGPIPDPMPPHGALLPPRRDCALLCQTGRLTQL